MVKILLFGCLGQVGWELQRTLSTLGEIFPLDEYDLDLTKFQAVREVLRDMSPDLIVNAAAYTNVEQAETDAELAMEVNGVVPGVLAEEAKGLGAVLIHYSTDYVFDGKKGSPYSEDDRPEPLNIYGKTKLAGEEAIQGIGGPYLILRTSWVYSLRSGHNFVAKVLRWAREQKTVRVVDDQISTPTWSRLIAEATAQIVSQGVRDLGEFFKTRTGIYHLACEGFGSRYEWARVVLDEDLHREEQSAVEILPAKSTDFPSPARRPAFSALNCDLLADRFGIRLPEWRYGLRLAMQESI